MEKFRSHDEVSHEEPAREPEMVYRALARRKEKDVLAAFTPEQQAEIKQKQQILSSLAYFIGKDFRIPVELNEAGAGWHWDFEKNVIRIDPKTLLERPMDELRYLICHEGGHRRVSRTDFIPLEEWRQPGFSAMTNFIEDPRNDNFVAESYPKYRENIDAAWGSFFEEEKKKMEALAEDRLGTKPRFMQAGYEYIRQWFNEIHNNQPMEVSEDLPEDVQKVVRATLESARDSWLRYPSRQEADKGGKIGKKQVDGETMIREYARTSYEINRDEVWPEFQKLVDSDMEDQKIQELIKDMQSPSAKATADKQGREQDQEGGESSGQSPAEEQAPSGVNLPQDLKDKLTPKEQEALEGAINKAIEEAKKDSEKVEGQGEEQGSASAEATADRQEAESPQQTSSEGKPRGMPVNLDSLPQELKNKIKEYIESLPEDQQREIAEKAQAALKDFEEALNEELQGKLSDNPEKSAAAKAMADKKVERKANQKEDEKRQAIVSAGERVTAGEPQKSPAKILGERVFSEKLAEMEREENAYEKYRREVIPLIDQLESELRQIFAERKVTAWKGGFKGGKRIDIKKRIQEKAKDVPVMESHAWQRRERPDEKDYAISLLVDVSGSMHWNDKSKEVLKSIIVLAEVLNRLGVNVEILGFNDEIKEYQAFDHSMSKTVRDNIGEIINDSASKRCTQCHMDHNATDIGWATQIAAEHLAKQKAAQKFLITLSDYQFEESPKHPANEYELGKMIKKVSENKDIHIIGLGIGQETESVSSYYPNSIANVKVKEMAKKLADLIKEVIANYDKF